jgi:Flp pilus assembly CpaF family ATPase
VIPPAAVDGPIVAIRRFSPAVEDLAGLVAAGGVDDDGAELLRRSVRARKNLLVAGGTGAGKTTLLNVLSREIDVEERTVTVEDAVELRLGGHVVRLEARPPNAEGAREITVRTLLRHALRLRPDRIVVGEVRGAEALDMVQAMNTGHDGSMSTIHANGPEEALWRLESLAAMATEAAEMRRDQRAATTQARLSAWVVGLAPLVFTGLVLAGGGVGSLGAAGGVGVLVIAAGVALEIAGLAAVALIIRREAR